MSEHLPGPSGPHDLEKQPEVRLELTRAGVEQVLSLYSREQDARRAESAFSIGLDELQQAILERRRMLWIGLAAGIALGLLVLLTSSPLYSVTAQVVVERHDAARTGSSDGSGSGGSAFVATQAEILASRSVVEAAVASLPRPGFLDADDDAAQAALAAVVATPISGTQVVSLGYLGPDARYGIALLEAIVVRYRGVVAALEKQSQDEKLAAKQVELDLLEQEAAELEKKIDALRRENEVAGSGDAAAESQAQIVRDYAQQIAEVRNQRIALETRLATGSGRLAILDPATRQLQEQLWQAEAELERLRLTLMPKHPAVEQAQRNVEALRKQLSASSSATPAAMRRDLEATRALENRLQEAQAREQARLDRLERYRREEQLLTAELEKLREMARTRRSELVDQRLLSRLAEAGEVGVTARMIEAPVPPEEATWPRPKLILPAGALVGLAGGLAAAVISLRRSRREAQWASPSPAGSAEVQIR